jgi:hypothetical protein
MNGAALCILASFSLVLGAILGALLYNRVRGGRAAGGPAEAPVIRASPFPAALCVVAAFDPPVSSHNLFNLAAWRRLDRHPALAHLVACHPDPAQSEMVAPVRRLARGTGRLGAINAPVAQEIVLRHFGVSMNSMPRPAANAAQPGKLIRMQAARASTPVHVEPHSRAS